MAALIYSLAAVETARGIVAFAVIYGILEGGGMVLSCIHIYSFIVKLQL